MKILYVANHGCGFNDDEGAIAWAMQQLGHDVLRFQQEAGRNAVDVKADFLLFHKWDDVKTLSQIKCPKIFWYFDLVTVLDESIRKRQEGRVAWMRRITPLVDVGFCTDGDWVAQDKTGKLVCLRQGADARVTGRGTGQGLNVPILFTGNVTGGTRRRSFVNEMMTRYGDRLLCINGGVHGKNLANLIADSKIVVAPDFPATDRYWSNRVYMALGFGAFLLHPWCEELARQYLEGTEVVFYRDRDDLHYKIEFYLEAERTGLRQRVAGAGLARTLAEHTYTHRCAELIRVVKERLKV